MFAVFGAVLVLIGANQDAIAAALDIHLAESGLITSLLALGIGTGMVVGAPLADRVRRRSLVLGGVWLAAAALLGVSADLSFARLLVHVFALGAGAGLASAVLNVVVVEHYGEAASRPLLVLHSAATLGAIAGPGLAATLGDAEHWTPSFRATGFAYLALSLCLLRVPLAEPASTRGALPSTRAALRDGAKPGGTPRPLELAAFCAAAFACLGIEASLTVFAVPYATEGLGLSGDRGRAAISAFWLGLLAGRMGAFVWRGPLDARLIAASGVAGAAVLAAAASLWTPRIEWTLGLVGVAIGPVFPLLVALAARSLPARPGLATGCLMGVGSLGGFAIPWLAGAIGDRAGVTATIGTLVGAALLLTIAAVLARAFRPRPSPPTLLPAVGLCSTCRHARRTSNRRGSEFWRCGRAGHEPS